MRAISASVASSATERLVARCRAGLLDTGGLMGPTALATGEDFSKNDRSQVSALAGGFST